MGRRARILRAQTRDPERPYVGGESVRTCWRRPELPGAPVLPLWQSRGKGTENHARQKVDERRQRWRLEEWRHRCHQETVRLQGGHRTDRFDRCFTEHQIGVAYRDHFDSDSIFCVNE